MTGIEILDEARRYGLRLEIRGGRIAVSAVGDRPKHLLDVIRANKAAVLSCLLQDKIGIGEQSETSEKSTRTNLHLPPRDLPLTALSSALEVWPSPTAVEMFRRVIEQGMPALRWCIARANDYFQRFPHSSFQEQEALAAADLLDWQDEFMGDQPRSRDMVARQITSE